jgi:hypothetical protein
MKREYAGLVGHAETVDLPFLQQEEERVAHRPVAPVAASAPMAREDKEVMMEFLFGDAAPHIEGALNFVGSNRQMGRAVSVGALGLGALFLGRM